MTPDTRWESVLKETSFDLSAERWQSLEDGLRRRIREASAPVLPEATLLDRLRDRLEQLVDLLVPARTAWATAAACAVLLVVGGLWLRPRTTSVVASLDRPWKAGEVIEVEGTDSWTWGSGRSRITLSHGSMRLDRDEDGQVAISVAKGEATFHVEHRLPDESFHVAFGSCRIEVVGTAFTIHADSLRSSARVLEGRVRFVGPAGTTLLDAGRELSCSAGGFPASVEDPAPAESQATAAPSVANLPAPASAPVPAAAVRSPADIAFDRLADACASSGPSCTEARAEFVRRFASDPRSPEVAWQWGQSARSHGDLRDALFAWDVAARDADRLGLRAAIAASELRLGSLPDADRAAKDLDRVLPRLDPGSTLWIRAWTLRRDAARALGQAEIASRAESLLARPTSVRGGP